MTPTPSSDPAVEDRLTWVGHSTVLLELGGLRLLTDPVLRSHVGPLVRVSAPADPAVAGGLDAVLLSHLHHDHMDIPSLRRISRATRVIVPRGADPPLRRLGFTDVAELAVGETIGVREVRVSAVPANHDGHRHPFGARAESVGYIIAGGQRVYFAGDTGLFGAMRELAGAIDVALVPVWGWGPTLGDGHLGPREAAEALTRLQPRQAVPIHWGTLYPLGLRRWRARPLTEPPRAFARLAVELAPAVDVCVLAPGGSLSLNLNWATRDIR